ncbi:hypothetical protein CHELA20_54484 [Hyphomicrobiales bacterium]|nr:hypothetical protein CHELA41_20442 [Hyphomicrobiales bacterium]CAH1686356.1 hypothetical protein CHELA20_54484 [Hyphomicrobiales bacterium]
MNSSLTSAIPTRCSMPPRISRKVCALSWKNARPVSIDATAITASLPAVAIAGQMDTYLPERELYPAGLGTCQLTAGDRHR